MPCDAWSVSYLSDLILGVSFKRRWACWRQVTALCVNGKIEAFHCRLALVFNIIIIVVVIIVLILIMIFIVIIITIGVFDRIASKVVMPSRFFMFSAYLNTVVIAKEILYDHLFSRVSCLFKRSII